MHIYQYNRFGFVHFLCLKHNFSTLVVFVHYNGILNTTLRQKKLVIIVSSSSLNRKHLWLRVAQCGLALIKKIVSDLV